MSKIFPSLLLVLMVSGASALYAELPAAGVDRIDTIVEMTVQIQSGPRRALDAQPFQLVLTGSMLVRRSDPRPVRGGGSVISTEILSMELTGTDPVLGAGVTPFQVRLVESPIPSTGEIRTSGRSAERAESFFDLFFEMDLGGLQLVNRDPVHLEAVINEIPPIESAYLYGPVTSTPVQLFRDRTSLGFLEEMKLIPVEPSHIPLIGTPPPGRTPFPGPGPKIPPINPGFFFPFFPILGVTISGTVFDASGAGPVPNVQVIAMKSPNDLTPLTPSSQDTTDAAGKYSFTVPQGSDGFFVLLPPGCTLPLFKAKQSPCEPYCILFSSGTEDGCCGFKNALQGQTFDFLLPCE